MGGRGKEGVREENAGEINRIYETRKEKVSCLFFCREFVARQVIRHNALLFGLLFEPFLQHILPNTWLL